MLVLKDILAKDPGSLSTEEKAFLREHASELDVDQTAKFAEAMKEEKEEEKGMDVEDVKKLVSTHIQEAMAKKVDEISTEIVAKFVAGAKEQRAKALGGKAPELDEKKEDQTRAFMKALLAGDQASAKAISKASRKAISTAEAGDAPDDVKAGLVIPNDLMTEVLRLKETQYGLARRDMRYLPFTGPGNTRQIPALGTSVSVFWTEEGGKKKSTQPQFSIVTQTLKKLAAIVPMTEEVLEDSAVNLTSLLAELFAEAVAKEEDLQFFNGTGTPWTGVLNNADINHVAGPVVDDITADDLLALVDKAPDAARNGSKFYMHRSVMSKLRLLKDLQGRYIFQGPSAGQPATLWDYPVETSDAFPSAADVEAGDSYVLFGNLKISCIFGDKQQLRVKLLDQATITDSDDTTVINLAEQDMVALRIVERVGYVCALPKALTALSSGEPSS